MDRALATIAPRLRPEQVVLDVGSVKLRPCALLERHLGGRIPHVGTHPLFGPVSLARAERPLRAVVCPSPRHLAAADAVRALFRGLGFETLDQRPEEHDEAMALTHALTFFLAKGLVDVGCVAETPFAPPSYHAIARTLEAVRGDGGHLFAAIQNENPYAAGARERLLASLRSTHRRLAEAEVEADAASPRSGRLAIPDLGSRSPELHEVRLLIDELDRELLTLLARRQELARRARRAKAGIGAPVLDAGRERALLQQRRAWAAEAALDPEGVAELFEVVLRLSRRAQGG
jgi:prephenate dehydrogenase